MAEQNADTVEAEAEPEDVKTCTDCGGTWPATRRHCIACGANLEGVSTRKVEQRAAAQKIDWGWMDALPSDSG